MNNKLTKSLTDIISEDLEATSSFDTNSNSNSNTFLGLTLTTWIIIILILALLGFNIFTYLAKGTEETTQLFNRFIVPVLKWFGYTTKQTIDVSATGTKAVLDTTLETTKQTIDVSATGTKAGVDIIAGTTTTAITGVQKGLSPVPVQDSIQQNHYDTDSWSLKDVLDDATSTRIENVMPNDSSSSHGKSGWCYIGEDNGFRACSKVGVNDMCMSGEIFPSRDICMNPSLRM
jgi:hypothetical protein